MSNPSTTHTSPTSTGVDTEYFCATTGLRLRASAVPNRASETCSPMASAISPPVNHLTMTFDTVMPHIS